MTHEPNAPTRGHDPIAELWEVAYQTVERLKTVEHSLAQLNTIIALLTAEQRRK